MKTLNEVKAAIDKPENLGKIPVKEDLENIPVTEIVESGSAVLTLYSNGWCQYRAGNHYTSFPLYKLDGYCYHTAKGNEILDSAFFEDKAWYLLPLLLGEDLIQRNQERILSNHGTFSYSAVAEDWNELESTDHVLEDMIRQEEIETFFHYLDDRQAYALRSYYCDSLSQEEIGKALGISQQNVSYLVRSSIRKLQKAYSAKESLPQSRRIRNKKVSC